MHARLLAAGIAPSQNDLEALDAYPILFEQMINAFAAIPQVAASATQLVFQPGGTAGQNVFTDWASLHAAFLTTNGFVNIVIDDSFVTPAIIPAGTYDFQNRASISGVNRDGGFFVKTQCQFADGAVLQNLFRFNGQITFESVSNSPVISTVVSTSFIITGDVNFLANGTAPFFSIGPGVFGLFKLHDFSGFTAGASAILDIGAGSNVNMQVFGAGFIAAGTVTGPAGSFYTELAFSASTGIGAAQAGFLGSLLVLFADQAAEVATSGLVAGNWVAPVPTNVLDALNRMAAVVAGAHGAIP